MGYICRRTVGVMVSIALVCALTVSIGSTNATAIIEESARQQAGGQHLSEESTTAGSIEGKVVEAETGEPMAYANVVFIGYQFGAMTNGDGSYSIHSVPPGRYAIMACMMGYESDTLCLVEVEGGKRLEISFELGPADPDRIQEIIVGDSELSCEIHDVRFEWIRTRIVGEPVLYDEAYERARRVVFPHADVEIYNACLSQTLDSMTVLGCPACVEARRIWLVYRQ